MNTALYSQPVYPQSKYEDDMAYLSKQEQPRDFASAIKDAPKPGIFATRKEAATVVGWWLVLVFAFYAIAATALDIARYFWTLV